MYQFDDKFLDSVGLSAMSEEQKEAFLDYAQEQFETKLGEAMSAQLDEAQLKEFDRVVDGDAEIIQEWMDKYPEYETDVDYRKILQAATDENDAKLNFVTKKWLDQNCPNYDELIQKTLADFQEEIYNQKDEILAE